MKEIKCGYCNKNITHNMIETNIDYFCSEDCKDKHRKKFSPEFRQSRQHDQDEPGKVLITPPEYENLKIPSKCLGSCTYSKSMDQEYPRECIVCGYPENKYLTGEEIEKGSREAQGCYCTSRMESGVIAHKKDCKWFLKQMQGGIIKDNPKPIHVSTCLDHDNIYRTVIFNDGTIWELVNGSKWNKLPPIPQD